MGNRLCGWCRGAERDKALERRERLRLHPHGSRVRESPVNDPMPNTDQPMIRQVMLKEVTEIVDGAIVTERRSTPRLFGDDTSRRIVRLETRHGVQPFDLSVKLERELASLHGEDGELDARGAGVQNENRVVGVAHRYRPRGFQELGSYRRWGRTSPAPSDRARRGPSRRRCRPVSTVNARMTADPARTRPRNTASRMTRWRTHRSPLAPRSASSTTTERGSAR